MKKVNTDGNIAESMRGSAYVSSVPKRAKGNGVSSTKAVGGDLRTKSGKGRRA